RRHMLPALRALILGIVAVGLVGCASPSPRYQSAYRYEPPADSAGQACLSKCGQKMEACQQRCSADYQACLAGIEPLVEGRYGEALKRYAAELDRYRWELERYQLYPPLGWYDPFWYGRGLHYPYYPWPGPFYFPPFAPIKPSRDEVLDRLRKEKCEVECGCQPIYDTCFLACGGKLIPEVKCIADCPEGK
ncbi:MAG: hypothetical protein ACYCY5_08180, partial [Sulfuricella sp.]